MNFHDFSRKASHWAGHPVAFAIACGTVMSWAVAGALKGYSEFWQLVINTPTTIATTLLVLLVQNTQNVKEARDSARDKAMHVKLDALIHATPGASDALIALEERTDAAINRAKEAIKEARNAGEEGD